MFSRSAIRIASNVAAAPLSTRSLATAARAAGAAPDFVEFPRETEGLDYSLNWSLADDGVTPHGEAFRNASLTRLLMHSSGSLSKSKAINVAGSAQDAPSFATDEFKGFSVMGIDEFEARSEEIRDGFSDAPRLFVEDAAVGSTREAEIRVRVISDSAEYALAFRNLLVSTPLYSAEAFPRPVVVYIATGASGPAFTASDFDPETSQASVVVSGSVPLADIRNQIAHVAGQLADAGGYRHKQGGGVRVQAARENGNIEWYLDDRYRVAAADEPHPELILLSGNATSDASGVTLTVGDVPSEGVFAAHHVMWTPSGLARVWDGASFAASHSDSLSRGSITMHGSTTTRLPFARAVSHPSKIVVRGGGDLKSSLGLTDSQAEKLDARISEHKVAVTSA